MKPRLDIPTRLIGLTGSPVPDDPGSWPNVLIIPDGKVPIAGGETLDLSQKVCEEIVRKFNEHGTDVPIDIEHQTLDEKRDDAGAVGWITSLSHVPGEGLIASVEWNERGLGFIQRLEYKYLSPVLEFADDGSFDRLHSVALTNKPATRFAKALLAASERLGVINMAKKKKTALPFVKTLKALQEGDVEPGVEMEGPDMGVTVGQILATLEIEAEPGAALPAVLVSILDAVKALKGGGSGEGEGDADGDSEESVAASEAFKELGTVLKLTDHKPKSVVTAVKAMLATSSNSATVKALTDRIAKMEAKEESDKIDGALQKYYDSTQINPNDAESVKRWRSLAEADFKLFTTHADALPPLVPQGEHFTKPIAGDGSRAAVLSEAVAELKATRLTSRVLGSPTAWLNESLREAGFEKSLTQEEADKYVRLADVA